MFIDCLCACKKEGSKEGEFKPFNIFQTLVLRPILSGSMSNGICDKPDNFGFISYK